MRKRVRKEALRHGRNNFELFLSQESRFGFRSFLLVFGNIRKGRRNEGCLHDKRNSDIGYVGYPMCTS